MVLNNEELLLIVGLWFVIPLHWGVNKGSMLIIFPSKLSLWDLGSTIWLDLQIFISTLSGTDRIELGSSWFFTPIQLGFIGLKGFSGFCGFCPHASMTSMPP